PEMVRATPAMGHLSAGVCHLGNISHKLGEPADGKKIYEAIAGKGPQHELIDSFQEHLILNKVDVQAVPRTLGPWLEFDPQTEKFTGELAEEANSHLTTTHRSGYEMPADLTNA